MQSGDLAAEYRYTNWSMKKANRKKDFQKKDIPSSLIRTRGSVILANVDRYIPVS